VKPRTRRLLYAANVLYAVVGVALATAMAMEGAVGQAIGTYVVAAVFGAFGVVMYYVDGLAGGGWLWDETVDIGD